MPWVRKDDQMPIHRKVAPLSDAAYRLHDEALCWASRNLTDGTIGVAELPEISKRGRLKLADELVARRLWHRAGDECPSEQCPPAGPDGWVIHDYWDYQPSKEKVLREKGAKADRQRRWMDARRHKKDGTRDASQDTAEGDAPTPPRPAPKEGGSGAPAATAARRAAAGLGGGGQGLNGGRSHPECPDHPGQLAHNCSACRSEQLGGVA